MIIFKSTYGSAKMAKPRHKILWGYGWVILAIGSIGMIGDQIQSRYQWSNLMSSQHQYQSAQILIL